jgi:hypothetical protein
VTLDGARRDGLTSRSATGCRSGRGGADPGAGTGLIGLSERTSLAGGGSSTAARRAATSELRAWLPWPAVSSPIRVCSPTTTRSSRSALSMMLAGTEDIRVVAEVADGARWPARSTPTSPTSC